MSAGGAWLVIDTAAPRGVVGVGVPPIGEQPASVLAERFLEETRRHAEELPGAIDAALAEAGVGRRDLKGIAVGRGPGSFIGVRVGIATAKGLAMGLGAPLRGVSTLLAVGGTASPAARPGLAALDARRGELYVLPFTHRGPAVEAAGEPRAIAPPALGELLATLSGGGEAPAVAGYLGPHREAAGDAPVELFPGPSAAGLLAALGADAASLPDESAALVPDYCRAPDAKLPAPPPAHQKH